MIKVSSPLSRHKININEIQNLIYSGMIQAGRPSRPEESLKKKILSIKIQVLILSSWRFRISNRKSNCDWKERFLYKKTGITQTKIWK